MSFNKYGINSTITYNEYIELKKTVKFKYESLDIQHAMAYTVDMKQEQTTLVLMGYQRFLLTKQWYKTLRDAFPDKEEYIKLVCKKKGIAYIPPLKVRY